MNKFQPIFDKQKDYFNADATKSYEWRIEQLDRMAKMLNENNEVFQEAVSKDFKTALEEKVFEVVAPLATIEFTKMQLKEWMKPISAMVPKALAARLPVSTNLQIFKKHFSTCPWRIVVLRPISLISQCCL